MTNFSVTVARIFDRTPLLPEFLTTWITSCFDYRFMESLNDVKRSRMNLINVSFPLEENSSSELTEVCVRSSFWLHYQLKIFWSFMKRPSRAGQSDPQKKTWTRTRNNHKAESGSRSSFSPFTRFGMNSSGSRRPMTSFSEGKTVQNMTPVWIVF